METLTIKIKNRSALKLIRHLEQLNLVQIVRKDLKESKPKLSSILSGGISPKQADNMHMELKQMRNEWGRDTY